MKKKIIAMMLSLTMVLNTFSAAAAAELEFTDGEVTEEAELFDDGNVVVEENEAAVAESDIPPEPEVETVRIGDDVTATITYVYIEDYGFYIRRPSEVVISGTGDTWDYLEDGYDNAEGNNKNPFGEVGFSSSGINIVIEDNITSIGDRLFSWCYIKKITIPESVVSIGKYAFERATFTTDVTLSENIIELGESVFEGAGFQGDAKLIQEGVIEIIPDAAFKDCGGLNAFNFQGVKEIGDYAFQGTGIKDINFSNELKKIGGAAFEGCGNIQKIELPVSLTLICGSAFSSCRSVTEIIIPDVAIDLDGAFSGCIALQEVSIPPNIISICGTFSGCSRLQNVNVYGTKTRLIWDFNEEWNDAFAYCPRLKTISGYDCSYAKQYANVRGISFSSLGEGTHEWSTEKIVDKQPTCTEAGSKSNHCVICDEKRSEEEIPALGHDWRNAVIIKEPTESEEGLVRYTCWRCSATKEDTIPPVGQAGSIQVGDNIWATIEGGALTLKGSGETYNNFNSSGWCNNREDIQEVIIDKNITGIGDFFFYGFTSLKEITFPEGLTQLGWGTLSGCDNLEQIVFPSTLKEIKCLDYGGEAPLKSLNSVVIPEGVEVIGEYAFSDCSNLTSIQLPSTIKDIGCAAFQYTGITSLNWPESVSTIPNGVFYCSNLKEFTVPETVTDIEKGAFSACPGLTKITIPRSVTYIGEDVFYDYRNLTIYGYRESAAERYANGNAIPFISIDFKVLFKENGRTVKTEYIIKGEDATPPELTKEGYSLSWDADYTDIQEDMIINAVWTKNGNGSSKPPIIIYPPEETKYMVTFKDRGKTIKTEKVKSGEAADLPYLYRYGYELTWDKDFSNVTSNMTVNAVWTIIKPEKVTSLTAEIISKKISLSWDESAYAGYYKVYRKAAADDKFTLVARTSQTLWNDKRAKAGVEYQYKAVAVRSVEGKIYTSPESEVVTVKLGAPEVGRVYTVGNLNYKVMNTSEVRVTGAAKSVASLVIPSAVSVYGKSFKVTSIDHKAFYENEDLIDVVMGKYITYVGQYSFYRCPNLESVTFGKNVEIISTCAFTECPKLGNIVLHEKVRRLGAKVFYHCPNLRRLYIKSNYLEYIGKKGLAIDRKTIIKVPERKYSAYKKMIEDSVKFAATKIDKL